MAAAWPDGAPAFKTAMLVPDHQELELQTVLLAVAAFPSKAGSLVVKALGSLAPHTEHRHLKRIRKAPDDASLLETWLCLLADDGGDASALPGAGASDAAAEMECSTSAGASADASGGTAPPWSELAVERLPQALQALFRQHGGVRLRGMRAAAVPPQSRQQWDVWNKMWPVTWRIPENGASVTEEQPVDARTQRYFEHHMRRALQLARGSGACNAAVMASPPALEPIAEGVDCSSAHPLQHAAMVAIEAAAQRDRALWPAEACPAANGVSTNAGGSSANGDCSMSNGHGEPPPPQQQQQPAEVPCNGAAAPACVGASSPCAKGGSACVSKRPRLGGGPQDASAAAAAAANGTAPATAAPADAAAAAAAAGPGPGPGPGPRPYMCTGYDCFVVREPCIMCAMALVHSRVQRVVYAVPDAQHGALGGCRRLHACRSLNHSYEVYRMELDADGGAGANGVANGAGGG